MQGGRAIAKVLKLEGTEYVFCFPNNPLIEAAAAEDIRPIITRTERTLVNMADGYTRASNGSHIGVCMVQAGPGIENAFAGIAQAYADSTPLLMLPGGPARQRLGLPSHFDPVENYRGVTKWADTINDALRIPEFLRRAFTYLRTGRSAPVLLQTPADVAAEELEESSLAYRPVKGTKSAGDPQDVAEAVRALAAARRPLIHVGQGVLWAGATEELREFAELVQAPVMTTTLGKSAFPEDHPLSIGIGGTTATGMVAHFLREADLVFSIGSSLSRTLVSCPIPPGKTMIQCTVDERDLNAEYALDHAVIGDAKLVLQQLIGEVKKQLGEGGRKGGEDTAKEVRAVRGAWLREWMPKLASEEVPMNPYRVIWDLMHTVDRRQTIVTHDSGNVRDQMAPFFEALVPRGYIGWGNSTQLGFSLGVSLGAKLAQPQKLVVNVLGDAAFGMCGMDFETAVRERIPILTVILNNSAMGGYERYLPVATERYRSKFLSGDYAKVAEALGGYCERVKEPADIVPALRRGMKVVQEGRPALIEMITREEQAFSRP